MKAVICTAYGPPDVLQLQEVPTPTPKANEVLVRVRATPINFGDLFARNAGAVSPRDFTMPGILWLPTRLEFGFNQPKKKILGSEFAGEIAAVGAGVTRYAVGDPVFGYLAQTMGANAEYLCMHEDGLLAPKPANVSCEEAAAIPYGALTALSLLRQVQVARGQKVLINGASGSIGRGAVQLAKYFGAEVTGVCGTQRVAMVRALGADHVIDYTREDFTQNGETYDLIFDVMNKSSFARCKRSLKPGGRYLLASFKLKQVRQMIWTRLTSDRKVVCALSGESRDNLVLIQQLIEAGKLKAVIDRCFPLEQAAEAHRYSEAGQRTGVVVLTVSQPA